MHPVLFRVGDLAVSSYGFALALSFALGIWVAYRRARTRGLDPSVVLDVSLWIVVTALVGSRFFYVATHFEDFQPPFGTLLDVVNPFGMEGRVQVAGLSVMGGFPAAALAAMAYLRWRRLPTLVYADLLAPSVALGAALTRVGCFFNGCCFGRVCELPFGVRFPPGSLPNSVLGDVPIHPTQLYQSAAGLAIFALLMWLERRKPFPGAIVFGLCALMGLQRALIEMVRHAEEPLVALRIGGAAVSHYQLVALGLVLVGAIGLALCARAAPALRACSRCNSGGRASSRSQRM